MKTKYEVITLHKGVLVSSNEFTAEQEEDAHFHFGQEVLAFDEEAYHAMNDFDFNNPSNAHKTDSGHTIILVTY